MIARRVVLITLLAATAGPGFAAGTGETDPLCIAVGPGGSRACGRDRVDTGTSTKLVPLERKNPSLVYDSTQAYGPAATYERPKVGNQDGSIPAVPAQPMGH